MKQVSVAKAATLINACIGEKVVRGNQCTEITDTHIDFEIEASRIDNPLNYLLTRLWRNLGTQAATRYARTGETRAVYEWQFAPPAGKLQLRYCADGRVFVRLVNESIERRSK